MCNARIRIEMGVRWLIYGASLPLLLFLSVQVNRTQAFTPLSSRLSAVASTTSHRTFPNEERCCKAQFSAMMSAASETANTVNGENSKTKTVATAMPNIRLNVNENSHIGLHLRNFVHEINVSWNRRCAFWLVR